MTILPIDYKRRPWKEKYLIDETHLFKGWFVFGTHENGNVDLSDGTEDIFTDVPKDVAQELIEIRREFIDRIIKIMC